MRIPDALKTARVGLLHAKVRSLLTILGIVIGISSVILLMSIGSSAQTLILDQVQGLGSNLIIVIPGGTISGRFSSPAAAQGIVVKSLKQRDLDALAQEPAVQKVTAEVRGQGKVVYRNNDLTVTYDGVTADFFTMRNFKTQSGFPFTKDDVDSFNHVAVIGSELAKTLFGNLNPLDKIIRLRDQSFRVVGILEKKGVGAFGIDQDNLVLIPITVGQKQLLGTDYFTDIIVQAKEEYAIDFVKSRVAAILRHNHGIANSSKDDFTINTQQDVLAILGNITSILTIFLTAIASISLVVGGIGIMNIMLVSVVERTKEIGLRKAVGATNGDILQQFLLEAIMITLVGGLIGIFFGAILTGAIYVIVSRFAGINWIFSLPLSAIFLALLVSTATGVIFGIYPARQAARKNPIEALRYE